MEAMSELPSYRSTKSDYYSHAKDLPPQLGGCGQVIFSCYYSPILSFENDLNVFFFFAFFYPRMRGLDIDSSKDEGA